MPELKAIVDYNRRALQAAQEGRIEQALLDLSMALRLSRDVRRVRLECYSKGNMGVVYLMAGKRREAALCFRMAFQRARSESGANRTFYRILLKNLREKSERSSLTC